MSAAKIGVITLFLLMAIGGIGGVMLGRLHIHFTCRVRWLANRSNPRSTITAASATSSAP